MKTILVTPNQSGDGTTSVTRDLSAALAALKAPTPNVVALDYAGGELWRQARRQDGFAAYPSQVFESAWSKQKARARHTLPDDDLNSHQRRSLTDAIDTGIDYALLDTRSPAFAESAAMVILVSRCDPRNLATLRQTYQELKTRNPNTYILLTQGAANGQVGIVTNAFIRAVDEKKVQAIRANGAPLVIPQAPHLHTLASREGLPAFKVSESESVSPADILAIRRAYHDAATEVRRLLTLADVTAKREARASVGAA